MTITSWRSAPTLHVAVGSETIAYRDLGRGGDTPLVCLPHFTAVLDDWDPRVIDGIAATRRVIAFDQRGIGGSTGTVPLSVGAMARDAVAFLDVLGLSRVDLLGFSLGGMVAQAIAVDRPDLVRRMVLAGTRSRRREQGNRAAGAGRRPRTHPPPSVPPASALRPVLPGHPCGEGRPGRLRRPAPRAHRGSGAARVGRRRPPPARRDHPVPDGPAARLTRVRQPTPVANGDRDVMMPSSYSRELAFRLPDATLRIYPDSAHGGVFQHHAAFVGDALALLGADSAP